jgi:hypothetical protein
VHWERAAGPLQGALTLKQQVWLIRNHEKAMHAYHVYLYELAQKVVTAIKYLRGAVGIGLGATTKYRAQRFCVEPELAPCVHKQNPHQNTSSFALVAQNYKYIFKKTDQQHVSPSLPPCLVCVSKILRHPAPLAPPEPG